MHSEHTRSLPLERRRCWSGRGADTLRTDTVRCGRDASHPQAAGVLPRRQRLLEPGGAALVEHVRELLQPLAENQHHPLQIRPDFIHPASTTTTPLTPGIVPERCSDGVKDQGTEEAFSRAYAKRKKLSRQFWKPSPVAHGSPLSAFSEPGSTLGGEIVISPSSQKGRDEIC